MSKINYDLKQIKAFVFDVDGVLSPATVPIDDDGTPRRMVNVKDAYAFQLAVKHAYKIAIINGGISPIAMKPFTALGIDDVFLGSGTKIELLEEWMRVNSLSSCEVVYVGDDIPDYECMLHVGLPVAPRDAAVEVKSIARYISPVEGGYGVARDIIEEVMRAQGLWLHPSHAFMW